MIRGGNNMNTKVNYLYRDADNYKQHNEEIISGTITEEQIQQILETLNDGEYFIPHLIGFAEVFCGSITDSDHPYFELHQTDFEETEAEPTVNLTAEQHLLMLFDSYFLIFVIV